MKKRRLLSFGFLLLLTLALAAYSNRSQSSGKAVIEVATDSDTAPFTCKGNNTFKGYDIDMVKAIFKGSKRHKVKFVTAAFDSILTGVDADRCQITANNFDYNEGRAEGYLFSNPISKSSYIITSTRGTSYDSLDDLSGKSTKVISGSNYAQVLEKWNGENPNKKPIKINYASSSAGLTAYVQHIENGTIDFISYDAVLSSYLVEGQGFNSTVTNIVNNIGGETDGSEYLLFTDTNERAKLQKFVNERIERLKDDGTLAGLSKQYFGGDSVSTID